MDQQVRISIINNADTAAVELLYRDAGWWRDDYSAGTFIPTILKQSFCFVGAFLEDGRMVGMGRAISDTASDAYLQDITVLKEYRNRGIGSRITRRLIRHLEQHGIDWIGLIGAPGTKRFYEQFGFKEMDGFIPMKLEKPEAGGLK